MRLYSLGMYRNYCSYRYGRGISSVSLTPGCCWMLARADTRVALHSWIHLIWKPVVVPSVSSRKGSGGRAFPRALSGIRYCVAEARGSTNPWILIRASKRGSRENLQEHREFPFLDRHPYTSVEIHQRLPPLQTAYYIARDFERHIGIERL